MALMWQEIHANYVPMVSMLAVKPATLTQMDHTPLAKGKLTPNGSYVPGNKRKLCPDGSYVAGSRCKLMPNGTYTGVN